MRWCYDSTEGLKKRHKSNGHGHWEGIRGTPGRPGNEGEVSPRGRTGRTPHPIRDEMGPDDHIIWMDHGHWGRDWEAHARILAWLRPPPLAASMVPVSVCRVGTWDWSQQQGKHHSTVTPLYLPRSATISYNPTSQRAVVPPVRGQTDRPTSSRPIISPHN